MIVKELKNFMLKPIDQNRKYRHSMNGINFGFGQAVSSDGRCLEIANQGWLETVSQ